MSLLLRHALPRPSNDEATEPHPALLMFEQEVVVAMAAHSEMQSHLQFQHLERVKPLGHEEGWEITLPASL